MQIITAQRSGHLQRVVSGWYRLLCILVLLLALPWFVPTTVLAQEDSWLEQSTNYFTILYTSGDETTAQAYAGFVDSIYDDLTVTFDHSTETPLTLRLYPTFESYYEVNPAAREMVGVVAHADFRRRELAVILPQTTQQTPDEIQNNIRHELTHIIASDLSGNRLNTGFQEGIAQYVEIPTAETERKMQLLSSAIDNDRLLTWSDFEDREKIYGEPERGYPQVLSAVTFLIETYGFEQFRTFLLNNAESSGYRSALEATYGLSSTELETQWLSWLPAYVDGSYQENPPVIGYDLSYANQLFTAGRYAEAESELRRLQELLQDSPQQEVLAEAENLLTLSRDGQRANQTAAEARAALEAADYALATGLIEQARAQYAALGDTRQEQVLAVYSARVERGLHAYERLEAAYELANSLRLPEARSQAEEAASEFAMLGDTARMGSAVELYNKIDNVQRLAGISFIAVGILGVLGSLALYRLRGKPEAW